MGKRESQLRYGLLHIVWDLEDGDGQLEVSKVTKSK